MRNYRFAPSEQRTADWFFSGAEGLLVIETIFLLVDYIIAALVVFLALLLWCTAALGWGLYIWWRKGIQ